MLNNSVRVRELLRRTDGRSFPIHREPPLKRHRFFGLTLPPRTGVLVPKTQIFLLRHVLISLVFVYGINGQDSTYFTVKSW